MKIGRKLSLANKREKAKRAQKERKAKHPKPQAVTDKGTPAKKDNDDRDD